jgi:hypothetical protein
MASSVAATESKPVFAFQNVILGEMLDTVSMKG